MSRVPGWRKKINSHEAFTHDSIDSLGYDWARIGDPSIAPKHPRKIYLPQTVRDVVDAVAEARALDERLVVRSKGHSSNDLVLADQGSVLLTEKLNRIVAVDEDDLTVTVQAGAISADVDEQLSARGLGLPVVGDHNHITIGGFASVGGISPASHRYGMFVDTVRALQYVTWAGDVVTCSRAEHPELFHAILAGLGQQGVITTLTVRVIGVDKYRTVLRNDQRHYWSADAFMTASARAIRDPGAAVMARGVWVDLPLPGGRSLGAGQFSAYHETRQSRWARLRDSVAYTFWHALGAVAGRLPRAVDRALKYVGLSSVLFSPRYATMKNVESFSDKILDATVGDPTRMLIVLAPADRYEALFRGGYALMRDFRRRHGCFTAISVYVKAIRSPYLAQGGPDDRFCEMTFFLGIARAGLPPDVLEDLVTRLDDLCIEHRAFRYMHTRTSRDPARRSKVDPNQHYATKHHATKHHAAQGDHHAT